MKGHGSKFSRKKEAAMAALLSQRSIEEAASIAGISTKTLRRWLNVPEFQAEYREARRQVLHHTFARIQHSTAAACVILLKIMTDASVPQAVRLKAATYVMDYALKGFEHEDIEARLRELERIANEKIEDSDGK